MNTTTYLVFCYSMVNQESNSLFSERLMQLLTHPIDKGLA